MKSKKIIKVLAGGRFNVVHEGHVYFLKKAKELGDYLIVVVANDKTIKREGKHLLSSQEQRKSSIEKLGIADEVLIGHESDIIKTVEKTRPDIIALGYDQSHNEKYLGKEFKERELKCAIVRLPKLKGYSTTKILNKIKRETVSTKD